MVHLFLFLPLVGTLLTSFTRGTLRIYIGILSTAVTFALGLSMLSPNISHTHSSPWIESLGIHYSLDFSGISLLLALVALFMTTLGLIYLATRADADVLQGHVPLVLAMTTGLLGIFGARDLILFYIFFEATLIPSLFMLGRFGRAGRARAGMRFAIYTVASGLFMLAAIIAARVITNAPSFELSTLAPLTAKLDTETQIWLLAGFLIAFAVKLPLWPLHGWLADFHANNHPSGIADLMGTLYKVGGYGLVQFAWPLFPEGARALAPWLMFFAGFTAIYAAWTAFAQQDIKRLLAYSSLSHAGIIALGLASLDRIGMSGAMYLLAAQGVYTGGLFLLTGMLDARLNPQKSPKAQGQAKTLEGFLNESSERQADAAFELGRVRGLAASAPVFAGSMLVLWFASIGVPGLAGFIGEFSAFLGAYQTNPWLAFLGLTSTVAAAAFALSAYQRLWFEEPTTHTYDLRPGELGVIAPVIIALVVFGLVTAPALQLIEPTSEHLSSAFSLPALSSTAPSSSGATQ